MNQAICPYCEHELATNRAKQCLWCGMDWHDPSNVVRRGEPIDLVACAERSIDSYERGLFTAMETVSRVIDCISRTNANQIVALLPDAVMQPLRKHIDAAPQTDKEWESFRTISIRSYCGRPNEPEQSESDAERESREVKERANYRLQIEALQACFASTDTA